MYTPKPFSITDESEIHRFIEANAFGQLISTVNGRFTSTHMPFLLSDDKSKLYGHMARQNPQWQHLSGQEVMITLEGAHDYISPNWYLNKGVPTWNYQAAHAYGNASIIDSNESLALVLKKLTEKYESNFEKPWIPDYDPKMLNAIVGIEINITEIQCKYKLSQNKPREERENIASNLKQQGSMRLSESMTSELNRN